MFKEKKKQQKIKIKGFDYPQALNEKIKNFENEHGFAFPATAHAAVCALLDQRQIESSHGKVKEFKIAVAARKFDVAYSSMYHGIQFLIKYGFVDLKIDGDQHTYVINGYDKWMSAGNYNYFRIPYTIFQTNIIAEFVRTANSRAFLLLFSLLNQFRVGVSKLSSIEKLSRLSQERTLSDLKQTLKKRSKAVREVLDLMRPVFNIEYVDQKTFGIQTWVKKIKFSLRSECVLENSDLFEIHPLEEEFKKHTAYVLEGNQIKHKTRDITDVVFAFRQEVIRVFKYIMDDKKDGQGEFSTRNMLIQSFFYDCIYKFEGHIKKLKEDGANFNFRKSIGAYFRTMYRSNLKGFIESELLKDGSSYATYIADANFEEFKRTGKVPALFTLTYNN